MDDKIKNWIEKKNKNLEIIQEKVNEEFQKNYTFTPAVNVDKKSSMIKRNFEQFYNDQETHKKKITEKLNIVIYI